MADMIFRCPCVTQGAWHAAAGNATYEYEFNHAIPGQENAVHSTELPYVFGFYPKTGNISGKFTDLDKKISELIETYWTNFAKTGDPSSPGVPKWPEQDSTGTYIQYSAGRKSADRDGAALLPMQCLSRLAECGLARDTLSGLPRDM